MFGLSCHSLILKKLQHDVQDMVHAMSIDLLPSVRMTPSCVGPAPPSNCPYSAGPAKKERTATAAATKKRKEWSGKLSINQISWGYFHFSLSLDALSLSSG